MLFNYYLLLIKYILFNWLSKKNKEILLNILNSYHIKDSKFISFKNNILIFYFNNTWKYVIYDLNKNKVYYEKYLKILENNNKIFYTVNINWYLNIYDKNYNLIINWKEKNIDFISHYSEWFFYVKTLEYW